MFFLIPFNTCFSSQSLTFVVKNKDEVQVNTVIVGIDQVIVECLLLEGICDYYFLGGTAKRTEHKKCPPCGFDEYFGSDWTPPCTRTHRMSDKCWMNLNWLIRICFSKKKKTLSACFVVWKQMRSAVTSACLMSNSFVPESEEMRSRLFLKCAD